MPRPRTPTALKLVTGRKGRVGINPREPKPKSAIGPAPAWMSDAQRAIWDSGVESAPSGVLTGSDRAVFTTWVVAVELHQQAALQIAEEGAIVTTTQGNVIQRPWVGILNRQAAVILRACGELGFTPASRSKVTVDGDEDEDKDPAAQYFN